MSAVTGWTAQSWEAAMDEVTAAVDEAAAALEDATTSQKTWRKKKHTHKGSKSAPCLLCGLGAGAGVHDPDAGPEDEPGPDTDAKAPAASHRTCKNCGAHMANDASSCQSCGKKWSASDALADKKTPPGANAPYKIVKKGGKFAVVNNTGETKSSFDTHAEALKYLRALYVNVPGASKRADKVKFSGKGKQRVPKKGD